MIDENHAIIDSGHTDYYVRVCSQVDREVLKPNVNVSLHRFSNAIVGVLPNDIEASVSRMKVGAGAFALLRCESGQSGIRDFEYVRCSKNPTLRGKTLAAWTCKNKKSRRQWSCP